MSVSQEVQGQVEGQTEGEETRLDQPESLYPNEFGNPLKGEVLWEEVVEEGDQSLQWKVRPPLVSFVWVDLELDLIGQEWRRGLGQQQWLPVDGTHTTLQLSKYLCLEMGVGLPQFYSRLQNTFTFTLSQEYRRLLCTATGSPKSSSQIL